MLPQPCVRGWLRDEYFKGKLGFYWRKKVKVDTRELAKIRLALAFLFQVIDLLCSQDWS